MDTEDIEEMVWKPWALPVAVGLVSVGIGACASYIYFKRKAKNTVVALDEEIEELKSVQLQLDFERAEKDREFNRAIAEASLVSSRLSAQGNELINALQHIKPSAVIGGEVLVQPSPEQLASITDEVLEQVPQPEVVVSEIATEERPDGDRRLKKLVSSRPVVNQEARVSNIFDNHDGWDYEAERNARTEEAPYIIHEDEYAENEMDFSQSTLTWYVKDQILTDEMDVPLYNPEAIVGDLRFGHGSGNPHIVFVRNEQLHAEYEILREEGSYEEIVLGNSIEVQYEEADLKHMQSPRRFRDD